MIEWIHEIRAAITIGHLLNLAWAIVFVAIGVFISRRVDSAVGRLSQLDTQQRVLFGRFARYGVLAIAIAGGLKQLGFDLTVLLGAAGVLTVAIGFAAQTSASNLISGIFLMIERPFVVGDIVQISDMTGEVMSIDLLSSKIRTLSNLMVRIPNETMVKSNITNYSFFPVRRADFNIGVGYGSNVKQVERILMEAANAHPLCLEEPAPIFIFQGFGDSAMNIQFQVWTITQNLLQVKNDLYVDIKNRFDRQGIEMPFPIRTVVMADPTPRDVTP